MSYQNGKSGASGHCPECEVLITIVGPLYEDRVLNCSNCDAELVVVETKPIRLDLLNERSEFLDVVESDSFDYEIQGDKVLRKKDKQRKKKKGSIEPIECPNCMAFFQFQANPRLDQRLKCQKCKTAVYVASLSPITLEIL